MALFVRTVQRKLLLLLLLVSIPPAAAGLTYLYINASEAIKSAFGTHAQERAEAAAGRLDVSLQQYFDAVTSAVTTVSPGASREQILASCRGLFDSAEIVPEAVAVGILSNLLPPSADTAADASRMLSQGAPVLLESPAAAATDFRMVMVARLPGETTTCLVVSTPVRFVVEPLLSTGVGGGDGAAGVFSVFHGLIGSRLPDERLNAAVAANIRRLKGTISGWFTVHDDPREPRVLGFAASRVLRLKQTDGTSAADWIVLSEVSLADAFHALDAFVWPVLIAAVPLTALLVLLSILLARWFLRPVHLLHRQAERLGRGDLGAVVDVRTGDELEDLARAFNEMARRLAAAHAAEEQHLHEIEDKVRERTAQLERTHRQLIQTERLVAAGRLAGNIAHEINNPLGIIKNYLRILRETSGRDPEALKIIDEELDRAARTIRLLLELHQPQPAKAGLLDVNAQIEALVTLIEGSLLRCGISLRLDLAPALPRILMPPDHLRQILINLLKNAEDACAQSGGTITVSTRAISGRVVITIRDTGVGIPAEHLGRVFEPFYTTKREGQGTGLGLPVTLSLVSNAGGTIELDSEAGAGTTVTLTFPAASDDHMARP